MSPVSGTPAEMPDANYPTTDELVAASTVTELTELTTGQQDALRAAAITAVESYCRQRFTPSGTEGDPVRQRLDGTGSTTLYLPQRLSQLVEISVVSSESGVGFSAEDVNLSDDRCRITLPGNAPGSTWADRAMADAYESRAVVFPDGVDNIAVDGVWGWTAEEYTDQLAGVTTAIRMDMEDKALAGAHKLADTVNASRALGVNSVQQGRLSINLAATTPDLSVRAQRQVVDLIFEYLGGASV